MSVEVHPEELERLLELGRKFSREGLTFDDVLLVPAESSVLPDEVSTTTRFTRGIEISIPLSSAAMDTVTEARMAIALAREGGIGVIHRNLSIEEQVAEVDKVKRSETGMIVDPVTLRPHDRVADALELMERYHISGVPITDASGRLVGILTNRDLRFETDHDQPIGDVMTQRATSSPCPSGRRSRRRRACCTSTGSRSSRSSTSDGQPAGPDHDQGHQEADPVPARAQGRARPAAGRRGGRRRPRRARARRAR